MIELVPGVQPTYYYVYTNMNWYQVLCLCIKVDVEKTIQVYTLAKKFMIDAKKEQEKMGRSKLAMTSLAAVDCNHGQT